MHLWLGLISGLIVTIVALTGCIYAFEPEIRAIMQPFQFVEIQDKPFLSPDELKEKAVQIIYTSHADSTNTVYGVTYGTANRAAQLSYNDNEDGYTILYLNPYTGDYLDKTIFKNDFFRFILSGHRNLWLPYAIGHQIVGWAVVIFVFLIITGIILSIPKHFTRKTLKATFTIKRKANYQRRNYDLHRVLGVYAAIFSLIISLTGLTWSFNWYGDTYYKIISGGKDLDKWTIPSSDTTSIDEPLGLSDRLWEISKQEYPIGQKGSFMFDFPSSKTGVYRISYNPDDKTYYKSDNRFFDQNTLEELKGGGIYGIKPDVSTNADKLYRMTYDIHIGAIGGLIGRILVFTASLIVATLPITGFLIYMKRKRGKKNKIRFSEERIDTF